MRGDVLNKFLHREFWPSDISLAARKNPHILRYYQGEMDTCEQCGGRFRRLTDRKVCARCRPGSLAGPADAA